MRYNTFTCYHVPRIKWSIADYFKKKKKKTRQEKLVEYERPPEQVKRKKYYFKPQLQYLWFWYEENTMLCVCIAGNVTHPLQATLNLLRGQHSLRLKFRSCTKIESQNLQVSSTKKQSPSPLLFSGYMKVMAQQRRIKIKTTIHLNTRGRPYYMLEQPTEEVGRLGGKVSEEP